VYRVLRAADTGWLAAIVRDAHRAQASASAGVSWLAHRGGACSHRGGCVAWPDYGTTGWLAFYLPKGTCVVQPTQRIRWVNMPEAGSEAARFSRAAHVDEARPGGRPYLAGDLYQGRDSR